jgi:hypothetical protein
MANVQDISDIRKTLRKRLPDLRRLYGIQTLKVFGSFLHGTQGPRSDVDLLVTFKRGSSITLIDFIRIEQELSRMLNRKVDLVEEDALKPGIGSRILREAVQV